jgi:hypothetical protein
MTMHNPPHPGGFIREVYLEPFGISSRQLASSLGVSPSTGNQKCTAFDSRIYFLTDVSAFQPKNKSVPDFGLWSSRMTDTATLIHPNVSACHERTADLYHLTRC